MNCKLVQYTYLCTYLVYMFGCGNGYRLLMEILTLLHGSHEKVTRSYVIARSNLDNSLRHHTTFCQNRIAHKNPNIVKTRSYWSRNKVNGPFHLSSCRLAVFDVDMSSIYKHPSSIIYKFICDHLVTPATGTLEGSRSISFHQGQKN